MQGRVGWAPRGPSRRSVATGFFFSISAPVAGAQPLLQRRFVPASDEAAAGHARIAAAARRRRHRRDYSVKCTLSM